MIELDNEDLFMRQKEREGNDMVQLVNSYYLFVSKMIFVGKPEFLLFTG